MCHDTGFVQRGLTVGQHHVPTDQLTPDNFKFSFGRIGCRCQQRLRLQQFDKRGVRTHVSHQWHQPQKTPTYQRYTLVFVQTRQIFFVAKFIFHIIGTCAQNKKQKRKFFSKCQDPQFVHVHKEQKKVHLPGCTSLPLTTICRNESKLNGVTGSGNVNFFAKRNGNPTSCVSM
jgi:hypothetical protein